MVVVVGFGVCPGGDLQSEGQSRIEGTALHRQHRRTRPHHCGHALPHPLKAIGIQAIGAAHHHQIGRLELFLEQVVNG